MYNFGLPGLLPTGYRSCCTLGLIYEYCGLPFPHDELRSVLYFILIALKAMNNSIIGANKPFKNIDKFMT